MFEAGQGGGLATSSKATGSKANEGANDGSDDDSNWVPTKKVKQAAKKKVASKTASTQEEKVGLRRIRERRNEHVNLLAKQLQEEANNEDADDHAAGNASSLKDAKQLQLQEDAEGGSDDGDSSVVDDTTSEYLERAIVESLRECCASAVKETSCAPKTKN